MSFKEFRDLLVLLYGDEIISDEEFLLLYDTFISKNPDFPHENYQRFDLDSMNSMECKAEFRVEKRDLPCLVAALCKIDTLSNGWRSYKSALFLVT